MIQLITMGFSFLMIIIMIFTIWANSKSLQKNTDNTIQAFRTEVSKQIDSYRESSNKHILAIKESTEAEIREARNIEKEKSKVYLLTLRKEIELNRSFILSNIECKDDYSKGTHYIVSYFHVSAYEQGMVTKYLTDENLINEILLFYGDMNAANGFIKMAIDANLFPLSGKKQMMAGYNKKIIELCEKNKDRCNKIIDELLKVKEVLNSQQ